MIKGLAASIGFFGSTNTPIIYNKMMGETLNEINHVVSPHIEVISSYYGAIHKKEKEKYLEPQVSADVRDGDMIMLFIATSGGVHETLPKGFKEIISAVKHKGDLTLRAAYKIWRDGDPFYWRVEKESRNFFVSLINLRGPKFAYDAQARINTDQGCDGKAQTPRVQTQENGAIVAAFAYDDPHAVSIKGQETLVSIKNGDDGMAVGISPSEGGLSRRIKAQADSCKRGGGDDIAMAISIY